MANLRHLLLIMSLAQLATGQCPWRRDALELHAECICDFSPGQINSANEQPINRMSIQCASVNFNQLLSALKQTASIELPDEATDRADWEQQLVSQAKLDLLHISNSSLERLPNNTFLTQALRLIGANADQQTEPISLNGPHKFVVALQSLHLNRCGIVTIEPNALNGLQSTLTSLSLSDNLIEHIPAAALERLVKLKVLDLSNNRLSAIPPNAFLKLNKLTTLRLADNRVQWPIAEQAFAGLHETLVDLNLKNTQLATFPAQALQNLRKLAFLNLAQNQISSLGSKAFANMHSLTAINLERNRISDLLEGTFDGVESSLSSLSLLGNLIDVYPQEQLSKLSNLRRLDLGFNNIELLPHNAFALNKRLILIALDGNPLETIPELAFKSIESSLRGISLGGKQLNCDCRLSWIIKWQRQYGLQISSRERNPQFCSRPHYLRSLVSFNALKPEHLTCDQSTTIVQTSTSERPARTIATTNPPPYVITFLPANQTSYKIAHNKSILWPSIANSNWLDSIEPPPELSSVVPLTSTSPSRRDASTQTTSSATSSTPTIMVSTATNHEHFNRALELSDLRIASTTDFNPAAVDSLTTSNLLQATSVGNLHMFANGLANLPEDELFASAEPTGKTNRHGYIHHSLRIKPLATTTEPSHTSSSTDSTHSQTRSVSPNSNPAQLEQANRSIKMTPPSYSSFGERAPQNYTGVFTRQAFLNTSTQPQNELALPTKGVRFVEESELPEKQTIMPAPVNRTTSKAPELPELDLSRINQATTSAVPSTNWPPVTRIAFQASPNNTRMSVSSIYRMTSSRLALPLNTTRAPVASSTSTQSPPQTITTGATFTTIEALQALRNLAASLRVPEQRVTSDITPKKLVEPTTSTEPTQTSKSRTSVTIHYSESSNSTNATPNQVSTREVSNQPEIARPRPPDLLVKPSLRAPRLETTPVAEVASIETVTLPIAGKTAPRSNVLESSIGLVTAIDGRLMEETISPTLSSSTKSSTQPRSSASTSMNTMTSNKPIEVRTEYSKVDTTLLVRDNNSNERTKEQPPISVDIQKAVGKKQFSSRVFARLINLADFDHLALILAGLLCISLMCVAICVTCICYSSRRRRLGSNTIDIFPPIGTSKQQLRDSFDSSGESTSSSADGFSTNQNKISALFCCFGIPTTRTIAASNEHVSRGRARPRRALIGDDCSSGGGSASSGARNSSSGSASSGDKSTAKLAVSGRHKEGASFATVGKTKQRKSGVNQAQSYPAGALDLQIVKATGSLHPLNQNYVQPNCGTKKRHFETVFSNSASNVWSQRRTSAELRRTASSLSCDSDKSCSPGANKNNHYNISEAHRTYLSSSALPFEAAMFVSTNENVSGECWSLNRKNGLLKTLQTYQDNGSGQLSSDKSTSDDSRTPLNGLQSARSDRKQPGRLNMVSGLNPTKDFLRRASRASSSFGPVAPLHLQQQQQHTSQYARYQQDSTMVDYIGSGLVPMSAEDQWPEPYVEPMLGGSSSSSAPSSQDQLAVKIHHLHAPVRNQIYSATQNEPPKAGSFLEHQTNPTNYSPDESHHQQVDGNTDLQRPRVAYDDAYLSNWHTVSHCAVSSNVQLRNGDKTTARLHGLENGFGRIATETSSSSSLLRYRSIPSLIETSPTQATKQFKLAGATSWLRWTPTGEIKSSSRAPVILNSANEQANSRQVVSPVGELQANNTMSDRASWLEDNQLESIYVASNQTAR